MSIDGATAQTVIQEFLSATGALNGQYQDALSLAASVRETAGSIHEQATELRAHLGPRSDEVRAAKVAYAAADDALRALNLAVDRLGRAESQLRRAADILSDRRP